MLVRKHRDLKPKRGAAMVIKETPRGHVKCTKTLKT